MDGVAKCFDLMDAIMNLRMQGESLEGIWMDGCILKILGWTNEF